MIWILVVRMELCKLAHSIIFVRLNLSLIINYVEMVKFTLNLMELLVLKHQFAKFGLMKRDLGNSFQLKAAQLKARQIKFYEYKWMKLKMMDMGLKMFLIKLRFLVLILREI